MARGINKVILVGNVGGDPELRYLPNGNPVATLSIATSESWKDKSSGEKQERTEWHRVVCFNKLGEIAGEYVRKGSKVYIEGSLRTRKWQDQQGVDRYTTEIIASDMQMLDSRMGSASPSMTDNSVPSMPTHSQNTYASGAPATTSQTPSYAPAQAFDDLNDDVPF